MQHGYDIEILLYPSDEFGGQEKPEDQIAAFVEKQGLPTTPGSGCTLMKKVKVNGANADPVWQLAKAAFPGEIKWNFAGIFVFDQTGMPVGRFNASQLDKVDAKLTALLA